MAPTTEILPMTELSRKPDVVILDRESRRKCSIYPLKDRPDMQFYEADQLVYPNTPADFFHGYLFLHVDGPELTANDCHLPLLILDGSWRRALYLSQKLAFWDRLEKRSIHGFTTAYPRKSKLYEMPQSGLASVEALYIARLIQGREDVSLLAHYYWRQQFLEINRDQIAARQKTDVGIGHA